MKKRNLSSAGAGLIALGVILGVCLACANSGNNNKNALSSSPIMTNSEVAKPALIVDIPKLMLQPPESFEKTFGKATEISKTNDPGTVPGEIRDYKIPGVTNPNSTTDGMMVRFYKGKAVMIMVDLPQPTSNVEAALSQTGIDLNGIVPTIEAPLARRWQSKSFNGIKFKDVAAHRLDLESKNFTTVQAEVEQ